jgi:hypothetical protein
MDNTKRKHRRNKHNINKYKKLYLFIEKLGVYILLAFALSLLINGFIAVKFYKEELTYRVEINEGIGYINLNNSSFTPLKTLEEHDKIEERRKMINWIGITAILGWCGVHPRFKKGIKKIFLFFHNVVKDRA